MLKKKKALEFFNNLGKYYLNFTSSQNKFRGGKKSFLQPWTINLAGMIVEARVEGARHSVGIHSSEGWPAPPNRTVFRKTLFEWVCRHSAWASLSVSLCLSLNIQY